MPNGQKIIRKLIAILSADVKGYSLLMADDEVHTIETLKAYRKIMADLIQQHSGRVVDNPGDNLLAEFGSSVEAVECAVQIQNRLKKKNVKFVDNKKLLFRIGVNIGDVVQDGDRIYGEGVNIAARIESLAEAGGICISRSTYDQIKNKLDHETEYLGEHEVKNIKEPVRVYKVLMDTDASRSLIEGHLELPDKPSIAILPFTNMSGDPEQEYFSDGITEDIITALSRSPWLFVISRNSSFVYRGTNVDIKLVSRELGVRYVLEGSVRKVGNRVRVSAQLIEGVMGTHVWAEKYDGDLTDIFDLQDKITQKIVSTLHTQIWIYYGVNTKQRKHPDIVTWDMVARGMKLGYDATEESLTATEEIARKAVAFDPESCDANYLLSAALFMQLWMGYRSDNDAAIIEAYNFAKRAISIDDYNEYAHYFLGLIQLFRLRHDEATFELKRAIELNPNFSLAYGSLGTVLSFSGEFKESIKNNEVAIRSNPKDPTIFFRYSGIAMVHYLEGRYSEAIRWAKKSIHRKPNWRIGYALLTASFAQLNQREEAKKTVDNYLENIPGETISSLHKVLPFKNPDDLLHLEEGLVKAGMPE